MAQATVRLEDIEVLVMRTDRTGPELLQRHTQLYHSIVEATTEVIYLGQALVRRLGRDNPTVKAILTKVRLALR